MAASGGATAYFDTKLSPSADIYAIILDRGRQAFPAHPEITRYLTYLGWLNGEEWIPPLMLYWQSCQGDPTKLENMLKRLDRFAYGMRLLGIGGNKRLSRINAVIAAIAKGTIDQPSDHSLELSGEDLKNIAYNLGSLHTRSQQTCKLVLLRLNEFMGGPVDGLDPAVLTVEHVLPQKPARNSGWRAWFLDADARAQCTQSLGNLVLVSRIANERARNMELPKKLEAYFAPSEGAPLAITSELVGLKEWKTVDVQRREARFLAALNSMWSLDGGNTSTAAESTPKRRRRRARNSAE